MPKPNEASEVRGSQFAVDGSGGSSQFAGLTDHRLDKLVLSILDIVHATLQLQTAMGMAEIHGLRGCRISGDWLLSSPGNLRLGKPIASGRCVYPLKYCRGAGRRTPREFRSHLSIAYGSLREVETQLLISHRLQYLGEGQLTKLMHLAGEAGRLLNGLQKSIDTMAVA